ncbi:MAG TPA: response regulator [Longimicrobiales bacterium]|jgi:DNA-binding NtrC family response regulator
MSANNKVLFVDDEEGVRLSFDRLLSAHGFDVTTVEDGGIAISELEDHPVDVVVSDLRMPGVDGLELLAWLRDKQPDTRFILLTGYGNDAVERRARELGAFEYLNKPISPDALATVVTAALHLGILPKEAPEAAARAEEIVEETREAGAALAVEAVVEEAVEAVAETSVEAPPEPGALRGALQIVGGLIMAPLMGAAFVAFFPVIAFGALFWAVGEVVRDSTRTAEGS